MTLPSDTIYDGNSKAVTAEAASGVTGMGTITVKYYDSENNKLTGAPTEIGTYKVKIDVTEGDSYTAATDVTDDTWTFTISEPGKVSTPTFSPVEGTYKASKDVTISCETDEAEIYFTTDKSTPSKENGTKYASAITVTDTTTIRAIAVKEGMTNSEVASATYTINPSSNDHNITVKNDGNGSATATPTSATAGTTVEIEATPNSGYHFKEWQVESGNINFDDKNSSTTTFAMVDSDVSIKAVFEKNPPGTYTVTFNANGHGEAPDAQTVISGEKAEYPEKPTVEGYIFGGWYTEKECNTLYDFTSPVTGNITLYAKWDDDQSIYGFRGACPSIMKRFMEEY
ncbi:MAG: InlB B-repeat-containing protein, partial [Lachnospiraceae bacterium]|nr:InlB B-repeat-containing protein [Lachnospiraceae bacterium]